MSINKNKAMDVSIIIPTKNAENYIEKCLLGVLSQKTLLNYEVLVIDSCSKDKTKEIVSKYPVKYCSIDEANFKHGDTRNHASGIANGKYLVFLTQDAVPADELWLEALIDDLKDNNVAGVYSRHLPRLGGNLLEERKTLEEFPGIREVRNKEYKKSNIYHFSNTSSAINKDIWTIHRFDEDAVFAEDQTWAEKVITAGYRIVYEPKSRVYHSHNYNLRQRFERSKISPTKRVDLLKTIAAAFIELSKDWQYITAKKTDMATKIYWACYAIPYRIVSSVIYWWSSLKCRMKIL